MRHLLAITFPGPFELMLLGGLGILIFAKRLPQVGRAIGQGIVEFRRALRDVEDEILRHLSEGQAANERGDEEETENHRDLLVFVITLALVLALLCLWLAHVFGGR